jgi:hypothetical protein
MHGEKWVSDIFRELFSEIYPCSDLLLDFWIRKYSEMALFG